MPVRTAKAFVRVSLGVIGLATGVVMVGVGCADFARSNGDSCTRSDDCLSGSCVAQLCVASQPVAASAYVDTPTVDADYAAFAVPDASGAPVVVPSVDAADEAGED